MEKKKKVKAPTVDKRPLDGIEFLKMALALNGIAIDRFTTELVIKNWEAIERLGGKFSIKDSVEIEWHLRKKYRKITAVAST